MPLARGSSLEIHTRLAIVALFLLVRLGRECQFDIVLPMHLGLIRGFRGDSNNIALLQALSFWQLYTAIAQSVACAR